MTIQQVSFSAILDAPNWDELKAEYERECSIPAIGPIKPNRTIYEQLEQNGIAYCFGVFVNAGECVALRGNAGKMEITHELPANYPPITREPVLVGFVNLLMSIYPHYSRKMATVESLFIAKAARPKISAPELMRRIEQFALDAGCVGILYSARAGSSFEAFLDAKKGYEQTNSVYFRSL